MKFNNRLLTALSVCVGLLSVAFASNPNPVFTYNGTAYPTVKVITNGQPMQSDTPAILFNSRTMVPLRFVSQTLGANVVWDSNSRSALVGLSNPLSLAPVPLPTLAPIADHGTFDGFSVVNVYVNGHKVDGDTPGILFNDRTLVPVRFVSQALGATVSWDPDTYTATITLPNNPPVPSGDPTGVTGTLGGGLTGAGSGSLPNLGSVTGAVGSASSLTGH